jgi:membrane protease YdiL (CAAX protease family)
MEIQRVPAYVSSVATLVVLLVGVWLVGGRRGGAAALGLGPAPVGTVLAWTAVLVVGGLALVAAFRQGAILLGLGETPMLRTLMPRTASERWLFAVLSVAAGVSEEVAYRGYALATLAAVSGAGWAAVSTSVVFGMLHAYQGWLGVMRTAALGGLLAWGFLASGTLWPSLIAHVGLDLLLGIVLADRLMVPGTGNGVPITIDDGDASPREEHGSGSGPAR